MDRHHHIVCVRCDKLVDYEDATLNDLPMPDARSRGFEVNDYSIQFRGICADCRKKSGRPIRRKRGSRIDRKRGRKG
jgi:Fe2+ or Zn2+ uptake regulation protein